MNLLAILNLKTDILGISETRIIKDKNPMTSQWKVMICIINQQNQVKEAAIYIKNNLESKPCIDLENKLYEPKKLESSFAEILVLVPLNLPFRCFD